MGRAKGITTVLASRAQTADSQIEKSRVSLEDFADKSDINIRLYAYQLERVLKDGQYRSMHQTNESNGDYNPETRTAKEMSLFGKKSNPKYGYLLNSDPADYYDDYEDLDYKGGLSVYGDVRIVLKNKMKNNSTITVGDSLLQESPVLTDMNSIASEAVAHKPNHDFRNSDLIEVQIPDDITLEDIETVIFDTGAPSKEIAEQLENKGLSWQVDPHWRHNFLQSAADASGVTMYEEPYEYLSPNEYVTRDFTYEDLEEQDRWTLEDLIENGALQFN